LSSAAALAHALGFARIEAALDAFEISGSAGVLLSGFGEVLRMNRRAEALLGRGIAVTGRRLVSSSPDATAAFDRALFRMIYDGGATLASPVAFPRSAGRPVLVYPCRLRGVAIDALSRRRSRRC